MESLDKTTETSLKEKELKKELFESLRDSEKYIYDHLEVIINGVNLCLNDSTLSFTSGEKQHLEYIKDQLVNGRFEVLKALNQTKTLSYISENPEKNQPFQK